MAEWRNRVVDAGEADPNSLVANPRNWRKHTDQQSKRLEAVLEQIGWVSEVIVNKTTGHLVDGHLRVGLAVARGEGSVPVTYVDLTVDEEAVVLASLDPLSALAIRDDAAVYGLLADIEAADELGPLVDWLKTSEQKAPAHPSQDKIDRTQEQMLDRFKNGPDGTGIEVCCPECGEEFGLAGIGVTS
jgi:hypothetical protein